MKPGELLLQVFDVLERGQLLDDAFNLGRLVTIKICLNHIVNYAHLAILNHCSVLSKSLIRKQS